MRYSNISEKEGCAITGAACLVWMGFYLVMLGAIVGVTVWVIVTVLQAMNVI